MNKTLKGSNPRILLISRYDSFTKLGVRFALLLKQKGWDVNFLILNPKLIPERILSAVLATLNQASIPTVHVNGLKISKYDALFFLVTGGFLKKLAIDWHLLNPTRPFLISAYPGLIYQNIYDGFVSRSFCDLIFLPSEFDLRNYLKFCQRFNVTPVAIKSGFFSNSDLEYTSTVTTEDFVFSEQSVAPNTAIERKYLSLRLIDFANSLYPNKLYLSQRIKDGEPGLFKTKFSILDGIKAKGKPNNLVVTNSSPLSLIRSGASSLTVSSTVGVEALEFTDRTYFVKDFGPSEQVGADFFVDSGVYVLFEDLIKGDRPEISEEWKKEHFDLINPDFIDQTLRDLIVHQCKQGIDNCQKLLPLELMSFAYRDVPSRRLLSGIRNFFQGLIKK